MKTRRQQKYEGADPYKETIEAVSASGFKTYGPLKALSEREAEKWFPGKTLIIRPGFIVGPRDESDRFTYWPVRIDRGGEVLAPGTPDDPVQFIDARDLGGVDDSDGRESRDWNLQCDWPGQTDRHWRHARRNQRCVEVEREVHVGEMKNF